MMKKSILVYPSAQSGYKINAKIYTDSSVQPKAILQIAHGMTEYIERYEYLAQFFTKNGFIVCGNDHLGHKDTALENKEMLGYFGEKGAWNALVEDVQTLKVYLQKEYPDLPYFLLGHSMGSFIARICAARYGDALNGLIISGTAGKNPAVKIGKVMATLIQKINGPQHINPLLVSMTVGGYSKKIPNAKTKYDWLTHDESIIKKYSTDPYCTYSFTTSANLELMELLDRCNQNKTYKNYPPQLPVYILSGSKDPVGNMGKGPKEVYNKLKKHGVQSVTLRLWENGRHEMHNETNKDEVLQELLIWLKSKI